MLYDSLQLKELLGSGAYGVVFRAFSPDLGRDVAIKFGDIAPRTVDDMRRLAESGLGIPILEYGETPYKDRQSCTWHEYIIMEIGTPLDFDDEAVDEAEFQRYAKLCRIGIALSKRIWRRCKIKFTDCHAGNLLIWDHHIVAIDIQ